MKTLLYMLVALGIACGNPLASKAITPDQIHLRDGNDTIIIDLPNQAQVLVVVDNLAQLRELGSVSIDSILAQVARQLQAATHYPGDTVMDFFIDERQGLKSMEPEVLKTDQRPPSENPCQTPDARLNLGLNFGGALIRNYLSPGLEVKISLDYGKGSVGIGMWNQYFFERENSQWNAHLNSFATASVGYDFAKDSRLRDRHELTVGYLVRNRGDIFGKNTFLLSYQKDDLKLRPILILTNNFQSVFPGFALMF
jgi:hypothetical protein